MILSKGCEYGIRAVIYLAKLNEEGYVSLKKISDELEISFHFLTKVFQKLTEASLIKSFKGPKGGVAIAKSSNQICINDIIYAIDGDDLYYRCVLGLPDCGIENPCPLHVAWSTIREDLQRLFCEETLENIVNNLDALPHRLKP